MKISFASRWPVRELVGLALCLALISTIAMAGQGTGDNATAAVQGTVRSEKGQALPGVTVSLRTPAGVEIGSARSDSSGRYRFSKLREGTYTVYAELQGAGKARADGIKIVQAESRDLDLTLTSSLPTAEKVPQSKPEFYDQPTFTVADVTDPTALGGHGSDTVVRTKESLAKTTASLGGSPGAAAETASRESEERRLRSLAEGSPNDSNANYQLGKFLLDAGKPREALSYLRHAADGDPGSFDAIYQLSRAYCGVEDYEHAAAAANAALGLRDTAEIHRVLGDIAERSGKPVQAVHEYELAATKDPSEPNLFVWGSELLLHRAPEPAAEIFTRGVRLFPQSERMLIGLGAAEFAGGFYEKAAERFSAASDLNQDDPLPYRLMSKVQSADRSQAARVAPKLARFASQHPDRAEANYFYAENLLKLRTTPEDASSHVIEELLKKAVQLDPGFTDAQIQLGILYAEKKKFPDALAAYQRALESNPGSEEAHYRLSQLYRQTGQPEKAKEELSFYEKLAKENATKIDRERKDIKQFVYKMR